jgi:hypothetical protein
METPLLLFRCGFSILLFIASCAFASVQDKTNFPTNDEINLMLTQADRAVQQYKPLIDQHERLLGKKAQQAAAKDQEVVRALEMAIKAFRQKPQGFNSALGFSFFEWIDDADRNALLCARGATNEAAGYLIDGNVAQAKELMQLAQTCSDAATLMYTVSENAGALYTRFVGGQERVALEGAEVTQKCRDMLKGTASKKNQ